MKDVADDASWSMKNAFADFFDSTSEGFMSLENLVQNVATSINWAIVDNISTTLVTSMFKNLKLSAHGNVFSGGHFVPFAKGGVVKQPTVFPFANGIGLMGEAGAEAIMPLTRLPGGDLGVKRRVAAAPNIVLNITNESGQPIEAETTTMQQAPDKIIANMIIKRKMTSRSFRQSLRG